MAEAHVGEVQATEEVAATTVAVAPVEQVAEEFTAEVAVEARTEQVAEEGTAIAAEGEGVQDKHFKRYKRRSSTPSSPPQVAKRRRLMEKMDYGFIPE